MKFIKKNKTYIIGGSVLLVLLLVMLVVIVNVIMPNNGANVYGNRLEGLDKVAIKDDTYRMIVGKLTDMDRVVSASSSESGRVANFVIDVEPETDLVTIGTMADKIVEDLSEEQKKYYDIQVFVTCTKDKENTIFPIIGYRHKTSGVFKWTDTK